MAGGAPTPAEAARRLTESGGNLPEHPRWREAIAPLVEAASRESGPTAPSGKRRLAAHPPEELPLLYAIVATGNIHEDVVQARRPRAPARSASP
jgi:hypothetical protein